MTIEFDTTEFVMSHGRNPRGFGSWAFSVVRSPDMHRDADKVVWVHRSTFTNAKKAAVAMVRAAFPSASTVWVLS
jgi:hypothetical protein